MNPIVEGKKSRNAATRKKAEKLEEQLRELARTIEAEAVDREALDEIDRLEQQLRTARAKLSGAKTSQAAGREKGRKAREWALANGVDCPTHGRVPQHVINAYELHA